MRIVFVVLHLGRQAMEVVVEEPGPKRRLISVSWQAREGLDVPPDNWVEMVQAEMDFQDSNRIPGLR